jgi:hypothetical protein
VWVTRLRVTLSLEGSLEFDSLSPGSSYHLSLVSFEPMSYCSVFQTDPKSRGGSSRSNPSTIAQRRAALLQLPRSRLSIGFIPKYLATF